MSSSEDIVLGNENARTFHIQKVRFFMPLSLIYDLVFDIADEFLVAELIFLMNIVVSTEPIR